jgi:hypothetical protein
MDANLTFTATRGSVAIKDFFVYRSIDNAPFSLLIIQPVETVVGTTYSATYTDANVVLTNNVRYYAVSRDNLFNLSADGNILTLTAGSNFILATDDGVTQWQKSVDGLSWTALAVTHIVRRIKWIESQNGLTKRFLAVGNGIWYSNDNGATWIAATAPGFTNGQDFDYSIDQEVAVAVTSDGGIWRSTDFGATWSDATSYTSQTFRSVQFDSTLSAGIWVAVASAGNPSTQRAQSSPDGNTWTLRSDSTVTGPRSVTSDELTKFIIIDALSFTIGFSQSADGITWSGAGTTPFNSGDNIDFGNGLFMMNGVDGSSNNVIQRSASGTGSWTTVVIGAAATLGTSREVQADFTRGRWWYVSRNKLHQSNDANGDAWTERATGTFLSCIGIKPA